MDVIIRKAKLSGEIRVPSSKSLAHRAIIASSLALGKSVIRNVSMSNDIEATIKAMESLGSIIERDGDTLTVYGSTVRRVNNLIDANESGSTLRFLIPVAMLSDEPVRFIGHNNLCNRPLDPYLDAFDEMGIVYKRGGSYLPLDIASRLKPGKYNICGNVSSQFITGLLFALPLLEADSVINITTPLESKGYIDLTLDVLKYYGINIINNDYKEFIIEGNQAYTPRDYVVEGDYSQAAFYLCMDALGADIKLLDMNLESNQGDKAILKCLEDLGSEVIYDNSRLYVSEAKNNTLIDLSQKPDLGPALSSLMALLKGTGNLIGASRLRIKECDRITSMNIELTKIGANIIEDFDSMRIRGVECFNSATFDSHNDHRVAMALAILSLRCNKEIRIKNAECVNKSYPSFWEDFKSLGGDISYE